MKAPRCQFCGVEEWGHLCVGSAPSEIWRRATRGAVTKTPVTKTRSVTKTVTIKVTPTIKVTQGKRGRPRSGEAPLSAAEKMRRYRERRRAALRALKGEGE